MIDLTPLDVRKKRGDFRRLFRGYDPEEVDSFLELVAERLEALVKKNLSLSEKADKQAQQLSALEERERAVQEALVTAQKLRDDVRNQTREEAELLKKEAEREAARRREGVQAEIDRKIGEVDGLIRERMEVVEEMERNRSQFLKGFRALLERELDAVQVEEARAPLDEVLLDLDLGGLAALADETFPELEEAEEEDEGDEVGEPTPVEALAPDQDLAPGEGPGGEEVPGEDTLGEETGGEVPEESGEGASASVRKEVLGPLPVDDEELREAWAKATSGAEDSRRTDPVEEVGGDAKEPESSGDGSSGEEKPGEKKAAQPFWLSAILKEEEERSGADGGDGEG
jgi:DivIVA domain-containing protein